MKPLRLLTGFALIVGLASTAQSQQQKVKYKISGDYVEGCACQILCACDFGQDANNKMGCQGTLVWHIDKGKYGDTKLDGLTVMGMLLKPVQNMSASMGKMEGGLYVDEKASEAQRQALAAIIADQYGALFGKLSGPKAVPISFSKGMADKEGLAGEYSIEIPHMLTLKITAIKDSAGKRSGRLNAPGGMAPVQYQGKSVTHTYDDQAWATTWDLAGRNALYNRFELASK
ncbi:MAG: DUF1326 domain-containing protein [Candidatus Latescibacteria bacterium]|nr:DUF1326 domain-containing protein [Candidatus Latescibacterota bacterium]